MNNAQAASKLSLHLRSVMFKKEARLHWFLVFHETKAGSKIQINETSVHKSRSLNWGDLMDFSIKGFR